MSTLEVQVIQARSGQTANTMFRNVNNGNPFLNANSSHVTIGHPSIGSTFSPGTLTTGGNIVPGTANTYTLGTSSASFQSAYFGSGIYLNGDTAAANLLDDYEEGTWTPVLASATTTTYTSQIGTYCKIGQLVFLYFDITINSVGDGSTNTLAGLPFTPINNDALSVSYFQSLAVSPYSLQFQMGVTGALAVGVTTAGATISNGLTIFGNSARVIASGCYRTAS